MITYNIILAIIGGLLVFYIYKNRDDQTSIVLGSILLGIVLGMAIEQTSYYSEVEYSDTYDIRSLDADAVSEACRVSFDSRRDFSF